MRSIRMCSIFEGFTVWSKRTKIVKLEWKVMKSISIGLFIKFIIREHNRGWW